MVEWIWDPIVATAAILLGSLAAYGLLIAGRRIVKPKPTPEKVKTYACGEELKPDEIHADSEQFFSPIRRVLKPFYRYIQPAHTGALNTYLLWAVVGFIIILVIILLTVR
ncbi:MAG: hypothetical protein QMD95_04175 [Candidatus Hodarchaeaceae archaeon]|nr:hypothetical protein [Candidatus Hodarchaeaceae archaeon]MDI6883989.1 hypothetical protein [Hadesarchaea archaeon]